MLLGSFCEGVDIHREEKIVDAVFTDFLVEQGDSWVTRPTSCPGHPRETLEGEKISEYYVKSLAPHRVISTCSAAGELREVVHED